MNRTRRRELLIALFATLVGGVGIGVLVPLIPLDMTAWTGGASIGGLANAFGMFSVFLIMPYAHHLWAQWGFGRVLGVSGLVMGAGTLLFPILPESVPLWLAVRFIVGAGIAVQWIGAEVWINAIIPDRIRGKMLALYAFCFCAGTLGGIVLIPMFSHGQSYLIAALCMLASGLAPFCVHNRKLPARVQRLSDIWSMICSIPTALTLALAAGVIFSSNWSLLSLYGLQGGLSEGQALTLVACFVLGTTVGQYPLGWLGDRYDRTTVITITAMVTLVVVVLLYQPRMHALNMIAMFVFGSASAGIYVLALAQMVEQVSARALANALFIGVFEVGSLVGSGAGGWILDQGWWHHFQIAIVLGLCLLLALHRRKGAGHAPQPGL